MGWGLLTLALDLLHFAPEPIGSRAALFAQGARETIALSVVAAVLGLWIGVLAGLSQLSHSVFLRKPAEAFVWLIRGTPLLVQILFAYYALPSLLPWLRLNEFTASVLALAFNVGAYNAEVVRAGILAVPKGQREASLSLGLSRYQTMRWVILPQALKIVIPALVNNGAALLKDSSLASTIGVYELSLAGNRISSETFLPVPVLITVAAVYLLLTTALTFFTGILEKTLRRTGGR
jgi:polar amino acid transport system permease protein